MPTPAHHQLLPRNTSHDAPDENAEQAQPLPVRLVKQFVRCLWAYRSTCTIFLAPVVFAPLIWAFPAYQSESRCAYIVAVMGVYWVFEVLPLAVTALMPMVLFPLLGVMKSDAVAKNYLPDTNFLFIGGLMVAVAVEKSQLHTRIALFVLTVVGSHPKWIMAGFMGVTGFLSMWISNTATAALMVPIVQSVIMELVKNQRVYESLAMNDSVEEGQRRRSLDGRRLSIKSEKALQTQHNKEFASYFTPRELSMAKGLLISVCFASNIGGAATITGTASNLVLIGQLDKLFPGADTGINFLSWLIFAFPMMLFCLIFCWFVLWMVFLRDAKPGSIAVTQKLREKYNKLPPTSFAEVAVMLCFLVLLALWVMRDPQVFPGFGQFFKRGYVTDATSAIFIAIILFTLPDDTPHCLQSQHKPGKPIVVRNSLLDWKAIQERFPWSVVLLLGGGFALASGVKESQLSAQIGEVMKMLDSLPPVLVLIVVVLVATALTNICSNTVIASIFVPIVAELARTLGMNPLMLMLPVTLASSFAFMLPVATPPNAIVFAAGFLKVSDMVISGFLLTIGCFAATIVNVLFWGRLVYGLDEFPDWARKEGDDLTLFPVNGTRFF